ncbi:dehydratase [Halobiforma lacisalsi AJ5]|uniref:Dehydratase n=1 Tax=Natronobacterium lacisalsi AJ5 TaxID=358396 RepID=M0LMZ7_NATLA|nr:CBS domain-containing protein [Halobiforma lacisalsi]APW97130.1 dehydratase [Halobiforma lacisalsi AJ5]EMA34468.1 MaoC domain-containing protein dehydratase [Halobiforma lacisalsi AJ5]
MHDTIPAAEIMVTDVVTAPPDASATRAATLMRDEGVSSVVVCGGRDDEPVGIVTEGDFATQLCERTDLGHLTLESVMSEPLETITEETSIVDTVAALKAAEVEHLPVVDPDSGGLVGIVTTTELSYYVPHLVHRGRVGGIDLEDGPRRRQVRTDTQYERDDWEFEYRGEDESTVSVGDFARFSKVLSDEDVEAFAEVSGDTNRLHLDDAYARETRFGERIVHGVLANGLISAALARLPGLTIYLSQESSFHAPLSIGDRVTAACEISEDLGGEKYRIETVVTDEDDTVVLEGDAVVLIDEIPAVPATGEESATAE